MKSTKKTYRGLKRELEEVLEWFEQTDTIDIDTATEKYALATSLIKELESYLTATKLAIEKPTKGSKKKA